MLIEKISLTLKFWTSHPWDHGTMVQPSLEVCSHTLSQPICKLRLPFFTFHQLVVKECLPLLICRHDTLKEGGATQSSLMIMWFWNAWS